MEIVAGITLRSIKPCVWDSKSPYYLSSLKALMISYADFHQMPARRRKAMDQGLHNHLNVPKHIRIFLDNGSFYFATHNDESPTKEYVEFVKYARPDWYPVPRDLIPTPKMTLEEQQSCLSSTMAMNCRYRQGRYVPVIHVSTVFEEYVSRLKSYKSLEKKESIALGGIVPNLLKAPKAMHPEKILENLMHVRTEFRDKKLHVFGIGGTVTLHIAALLGINSVDSSGWRNRAARGIIQLPGTGDRVVAELGNWRGRKPNESEWLALAECGCPACRNYGLEGLRANKVYGFRNRATHNLWILLEEARLVQEHLLADDYKDWYHTHLDNSLYLGLIRKILEIEKS